MSQPHNSQLSRATPVLRPARPWRELAILSTLLMELSWIVLWYRLLFAARAGLGYWQALFALGVMLFSSYGVAKWMDAAGLKLWLRRAALAGLWLAFLTVGLRILLPLPGSFSLLGMLNSPVDTWRDIYDLVPSEFLVMLFVLLVCWRGVARVGSLISTEEVLTAFKIGTLMFLGYGLSSGLFNLPPVGELPLFLFSGLLALSSARMAVISSLRGGQRIPFEKRRLLGISGAILAMVAFSSLLSNLATGSGAKILTALATGVVYLLALLFSPLMFLLMLAFFAMGRLINIAALLQNLITLLNRLQALIEGFTFQLQQWLSGFQLPWFNRLIAFFNLPPSVILWGALLILLVAILLIVRRGVLMGGEEVEAEFETLTDEVGLLDQLRKALRRGWGAMADGVGQMRRLRAAQRMLAAARVRRIYALLLELSARLDCPRPAARTPLEFLPTLENLFPTLKGELRLITEAYLLVRYGELPESQEELAAVESAWQRVADTGRARLKSQKGKV